MGVHDCSTTASGVGAPKQGASRLNRIRGVWGSQESGIRDQESGAVMRGPYRGPRKGTHRSTRIRGLKEHYIGLEN